MKSYKDFKKQIIGSSDIAGLILAGPGVHGLSTKELWFGGDGTYEAYIVDEDAVEIGAHYEKVASFETWLKIYDDAGLTARFNADRIDVYRAGEMGCIIHLINKA